MANQTTTWRALFSKEMKNHNETFDDAIGRSVTEEELDSPFNPFDETYSYQSAKVVVATNERVYFNIDSYDLDACDYKASIESLPKTRWECIHGPLSFL
jgi:hypothetical protein